jgi:purine-binding chemotaxis protein CheW
MTQDSDALRLLPLRVAGERIVLPALAVEEILGARSYVPIPGAPPHLPGVVAWRGRAVAVLDLGALTGGTRAGGGERTVLVHVGPGVLAIPADGVEAVVQVEPKHLRPAHATRHRFATLEVELGADVVPLLDLDRLAAALQERGAA